MSNFIKTFHQLTKSNAAIVSQELGIPCIIGMKIATRVFKDGDVVEVNANHGWVRKVSQ